MVRRRIRGDAGHEALFQRRDENRPEKYVPELLLEDGHPRRGDEKS